MKCRTGVISTIALTLFPIAALAADEPPLSAAAGFATDSFTLILKIGVPSGLISGLLTLLVTYWNNKAAQKNNREKITAEADNISRQINQRQHEFEIQTKIQIESLHSNEKKKICADFLVCVNPSLFQKDTFDSDKMTLSIPLLYLYCKIEYLSYFKNLVFFIRRNNMSAFGKKYLNSLAKITYYEKKIKMNSNMTNQGGQLSAPESELLAQQLTEEVEQKIKLRSLWNEYAGHYGLALEAAQKMIWNEPIEEAEPLQRKEHQDEDDT